MTSKQETAKLLITLFLCRPVKVLMTKMLSKQLEPLTIDDSSQLLGDPASQAAIALSPFAVLLAAALLLVNGAISAKFSLGWHKSLVVACTRCVVQLTIIGYILAAVFSVNTWWLVVLYTAVMVLVASLEAVSRPAASYKVKSESAPKLQPHPVLLRALS